MIDPETGLPASDTNGSHPDRVLAEIMVLERVYAVEIKAKYDKDGDGRAGHAGSLKDLDGKEPERRQHEPIPARPGR